MTIYGDLEKSKTQNYLTFVKQFCIFVLERFTFLKGVLLWMILSKN